MTINVNDTVRVKLNGIGRKALAEHFQVGQIKSAPPPHADSYGRHSFQLWEFMFIFGKYTYLGNDLPFESGDIEVLGTP